MSAPTNPHVHAVFGELFDRMFPVIAAPRPLSPAPSDLPDLTPAELAEGDLTAEKR